MRLRKCVAGISVAAALLAGGFAPTAVADDEGIPPSALSETMSSNGDESMDIATAINKMAVESGDGAATDMEPAGETGNSPVNDSSDTASGQPDADGEAFADGGATARSAPDASKASDTAKDQLNAVIEATADNNLTPLASGYRADDSGTAPYDTWKANPDDLKALHEARQAAQAVADSSDASEEQVTQAAQDLQAAFDAVRFIYHYTGITGTNGMRMYDNNGNLIQAHGAGIVKAKTSTLAEADRALDENGDGTVYIWCGEDKTDRLVAHGVRIYYSDDLLNWVDKGLGFQTYLGDDDLADKMAGADPVYQQYYNVENIATDPDYTNIYGEDFSTFADDASNYNIDSPQDALDKLLWDLKALYGDGSNPTKTSCVFERPKMVYNEATNRWIIWFHADGPQYGNEDTATYSKAKAGVAVSITGDPAGPYKYLGSFRMSPGTNSGNPGMARDMNVYVDDKDANGDGANDAYLIYASNENRDLTISLLDRTYTKLVVPVAQQVRGTSVADGATYNIIATDSRESPAPVKWNGHYYIIYSHTTGWAPNQNEYVMSEGDNILGPYTSEGCPFVAGDGYEQNPSNSFYTQSSSIIPVDAAKGMFIYWGDRWFNPDTGNDISQSRYVMTPIQFVGDRLRVLPRGDWTLDELDQYQAVRVVSELPTETGSMTDLMNSLPDTLQVLRGDATEPVATPVKWERYFGADQPAGEVTVNGTLTELNNVQVSFTVTVYPKSTVLFMDAGSSADNESEYYEAIRRNAPDLINGEVSDQPYSEGGWGYSSTVAPDGNMQLYGTDSNDIYETGWYANTGKTIEYKADLASGTYTVTAGFKDWWAEWNDRTVHFVVSDENGELASTDVFADSGNASDALTFTLDKAATVTFSAQRSNVNSLDPVLSWINVTKAAADEVVSVEPCDGTVGFLEGSDPELPAEATVTLADGSTADRAVTWMLDDVDVKPFVLTQVKGVVDGTTLPATATIQMIPENLEYFIDVNGGADSPTYATADKLTERELANAVPDQASDGVWGNASEDYGTEYTGDADPYMSGIYAGASGSNKPLSYQLTLPQGEHTVMLGFHDWWNQTRPTSVTYRIGDGDEVALASVTVDSGNVVAEGTITVPEGDPQTVTITLTSSQGTGPVLSWLAASQPEKQPGGEGGGETGGEGGGETGGDKPSGDAEPSGDANKPATVPATGSAVLGVAAAAVLLAAIAGAMTIVRRKRA